MPFGIPNKSPPPTPGECLQTSLTIIQHKFRWRHSAKQQVNNGINVAWVLSFTECASCVSLCVNVIKVFTPWEMGSTNTFITTSLARRLNLSDYQHNYVMKKVSHVKLACSKVVEINFSVLDGSLTEDISNILLATSIPPKYAMHDIDISKYPHLSDLPITPVDQIHR